MAQTCSELKSYKSPIANKIHQTTLPDSTVLVLSHDIISCLQTLAPASGFLVCLFFNLFVVVQECGSMNVNRGSIIMPYMKGAI